MLFEIRKHRLEMESMVQRRVELRGGNTGKVNNLNARYDMTDSFNSPDTAIEIDIVEEERKPLVEQKAQRCKEFPPKETEGSPWLFDSFNIIESEISVEIVVLETTAEEKTVHSSAQPVVVGNHVKDAR